MLTATKKYSLAVVVSATGLVLALILSMTIFTRNSGAVDPSAQGFNAGNIIDDSVFTNQSSMTVDQVQAFLNSKVPTCDTSGSQLSELDNTGVTDYNGDGSIERWEYGKFYFNQTTFTCLKDYSQNGLSSAQIIYNASQKYQINPRVLIVLLQKEQSLVTDTWPNNIQYRSATGYGCPDTSSCDASYYGLTNQVNWAATMFHAIETNNPNWYTPYILGDNYIQYNPDSSCGGSTVNIRNRATQALYNYTPYQPNQATLDAPMGTTVTCGAYGNIHFYQYFTQWFGSTTGPDYAWRADNVQLYLDKNLTQNVPMNAGSFYLRPGQQAYVSVKATNIGRTTWQQTNTRLGTFSPLDYSSPFKDAGWTSSNRIVSLNEASVAPNQQGSFTFTITAPQTENNYTETYSIVVENIAWLSNANIRLPFVVTNPLPESSLNTNYKLLSGDTLSSGSTILSPERNSVLKLQTNGNLELYKNFQKIWETKTANTGSSKLMNQSDGNLVLYGQKGATWSSGTAGGSSSLVLQSDGNLVLYGQKGATWSSGTAGQDQTGIINQKLPNTGIIFPGQSLTTPDKKYTFILQLDGNIVLYSPSGALWSSRTYGKKPGELIMQTDGNLVLYDINGYPIWSTDSFGNGPSNLYMQTDGNLVLYSSTRATWASGTNQR